MPKRKGSTWRVSKENWNRGSCDRLTHWVWTLELKAGQKPSFPMFISILLQFSLLREEEHTQGGRARKRPEKHNGAAHRSAIASCGILLLMLVPWAQGQGQPPEASEEAWAEGQPPEASEEALTMLLSESGCGAFAGLVAATPVVGEAFCKQSGSDLGLTIFCPDDDAVAAFIPRFNGLTADGQVALLLYHGLTMAYSVEVLRSEWGVFTLDGGQMVTIREHRGTLTLSSWPPPSRNQARITKMAVDSGHLVVYLIDAVLIPTEPEPGLSLSDFLGPFLLLVAGRLALI
ncbi:hypothetical protein ACQJBY_008916 [Aegilops geniculata]